MLSETLEVLKTDCLGQNQSLPSRCYTSEAFLQLEREKVFSSGWVCLGRCDEIPRVGDYFTTRLLNEPLVVTRDADNRIQVLSNVCRHRGMRLADGAGNADRLRCPYHAWSYQLDGSLRHAPMMNGAVSKKTCKLPALKAVSWGGFIFATLDSNAASLVAELTLLEQEIGNYHMQNMHHLHSFDETWRCNWKCLVENFMDGYHLSVVHPTTLKPLTPTNLCEKFAGSPAYTGYNAHYPDSAPERLGGHPDLSDAERRQSRLFCIFPSLVVSVSADATAWLSMQPDGVDQVSVRWGLASARNDLSATEQQALVDKWQQINAEDHAILEQLQIGLGSSWFEGGALGPADLEGTVSEFHDYLIRKLLATGS